MIKILSADQIKEADSATIHHEPVSSIDLMERAASAFTELFVKKYSTESAICIFCGYGNNGGDGLAIARLLIEKGYTVSVYVLADSKNYSDDFLINQSRLESSGKFVIHPITSPDDFPGINTGSVIIDALFGSGLNRALSGVAEKLVLYLNIQNTVRIAVDIPSGLFADSVSNKAIFMAHHTITFQQPKLSFLFPENAPVTGKWESVDIALDKKYMDFISCNHFLIEKPDIEKIIHQRRKFDHKGIFGHALLYAGSKGKMGAAILCAMAALRSGAGLATVLLPAGTEGILNATLPEAMTMSWSMKGKANGNLTAFSAVASGPGIGTDLDSTTLLLKLLKAITASSVFDADALNILAAQKKGLKLLPENSIITPHIKEFERLAGKSNNWYERHQRQLLLSTTHSIYIILKGAYTCITTPGGVSYFNPTGNPAMAKGGSGDVLTGIVAGLLAQKYSPLEACLLGVYLHGLSGDLAVKKESVHSLLATDIIGTIGDAFRELATEET